MEILAILILVIVVIYLIVRKYKKVSRGDSCCR